MSQAARSHRSTAQGASLAHTELYLQTMQRRDALRWPAQTDRLSVTQHQYFVSLNHLPKSDYMRSCHGNFLETGMARRTGRSELKLSQEHKVMLKELAGSRT